MISPFSTIESEIYAAVEHLQKTGIVHLGDRVNCYSGVVLAGESEFVTINDKQVKVRSDRFYAENHGQMRELGTALEAVRSAMVRIVGGME